MVEATQELVSAEFQNLGEIPDKVMNDEVREYEADLEDEFFIIPYGDY